MPSDSTPTLIRCADLTDELAAAEDGQTLAPDARAHVDQCLRCQAEVAHYRRMRRTLRMLADHPAPADPALESDILTSLDEFVPSIRRFQRVPARRAATLGGIAAAAGVIALAARQRRLAS